MTACTFRSVLSDEVVSAARDLQERINVSDDGQEVLALTNVKRIAQELLDAVRKLSQHENEHNCV
jgi:restriction endonuclease Mrr